jgi:hypothetical protein
MREKRGAHFEERRKRKLKSHASQESLSLRKRVCHRGSWHTSLGEGLAHTPRRNSSSFFYSVHTTATVRLYIKKRRHRNRGCHFCSSWHDFQGFFCCENHTAVYCTKQLSGTFSKAVLKLVLIVLGHGGRTLGAQISRLSVFTVLLRKRCWKSETSSVLYMLRNLTAITLK